MRQTTLLTLGAALAIGGIFAYQKFAGTSDRIQQTETSLNQESLMPSSQTENLNKSEVSSSQSNARPPSQTNTLSDNPVQQVIENGEAPGTSESTRAGFFEPFDWGASLSAASSLQQQQLNFSESCQSHARFNPALQPEQWARQFTQADSTQRWPSGASHVIDWNQFWKLGETGFQISIRWNFELPPLYRVVGYSFSMTSPDGYGAEALPEKNKLTWPEARQYVQEWENTMLSQGGRAGTRTMSLSSSPFNPADVAPEDIERAEYMNTRVRGAQTGRMSCNTLYDKADTLSCRCY